MIKVFYILSANQIKGSKTCDLNSYCLKSSVRLMQIVVMGMVKQMRISPPLKRAKNPSVLYIL